MASTQTTGGGRFNVVGSIAVCCSGWRLHRDVVESLVDVQRYCELSKLSGMNMSYTTVDDGKALWTQEMLLLALATAIATAHVFSRRAWPLCGLQQTAPSMVPSACT